MDRILIVADVASGTPQGGGLQMLMVYALLFLGMWFLLINPQRKKQKNQQKMIESLKSGDKVVTASGIIGTIASVKGSKFVVKIADDVKVEIFRSYILSKLDKSE